MKKFWIILPLAPGVTPHLSPTRYDYLDGDDGALAAASALALRRPTPEGYAIMECIKVTGQPVAAVEFQEPAAAKARPLPQNGDGLRASSADKPQAGQQAGTGQPPPPPPPRDPVITPQGAPVI